MAGPNINGVHKFDGDIHGNCFVCGQGQISPHHARLFIDPESQTHFMFEVESGDSYEVMFDSATQTFVPVTKDDYEIVTGHMYPVEPLPDRILNWFGDVGDAMYDKLTGFFDSYFGKWVGIVLLVGFLLVVLFLLVAFVVLVIGSFIYGPDVCADFVWPGIIKYSDGGC